MSDLIQKKLVDFEKYCKKCKYWETKEEDDPCNYCMTQNYNDNSHIPVSYDGPRPEKKERKND